MSADDHKSSKSRSTAPAFVMPDKIEAAIECQRNRLITAITLVYCLHSALRRRLEDAGPVESIAVEVASRSAELSVITEMLLEYMHSVHQGLDSTVLARYTKGPSP